MKRRFILNKLISGVVCASMILSLTACGDSASTPATNDENVAEITETEITSTQSVDDNENSDAKEKHSDFYMEVNKDWIDANPLKEGQYDLLYADKFYFSMVDKFCTILEGSSPEDFKEDEPSGKYVAFYQQLISEGQTRDKAMSRLHELVEAIEAPQTVNQFYTEVMMNDDLASFNLLMSMKYVLQSNNYYYPEFRPCNLLQLHMEKTDEEWQIMQEGYANMIMALGYSSEVATAMSANAITVDKKVWDYICNVEGYSYFYSEENWEEADCSFPFFEILKALDYSYNEDGMKYYFFFANPNYLSFMQELYTAENLQMLKDYVVVCMLDQMYGLGGESILTAQENLWKKIVGLPEVSRSARESDLQRYSACNVLKYDDGALARIYYQKYITEQTKNEIRDIGNDIKKK